MRIPFNKSEIIGKEIEYIEESVKGKISGDGQFTYNCSELLEKSLSVNKVLMTTSCTHALEMTSLLLDIKPGDEVIVPSFTFVSTVNAFVLRGAKPVFVDIRADTLNMDEKLLERLITDRTKAIVPVHYAGVGCEMDVIMNISNKYNIPIIEDNAHSLFGKYKGQYLGSFGSFATQSFHETKNFFCGEGGALIINDADFIERAEIIREKGTNRSKFFRGQVDKYSWIDLGSSYLPSDMLSAFLYAQLIERDLIQSNRKKIWDFYNNKLKRWSKENRIRLPVVPEHCEQAYHMFYLLMPSLKARTSFMKNLGEKGISTVFHYLPLHSSEMGYKSGFKKGDCPITEDVSDRLVRLPFYNTMTDDEMEYIVKTILDIKF